MKSAWEYKWQCTDCGAIYDPEAPLEDGPCPQWRGAGCFLEHMCNPDAHPQMRIYGRGELVPDEGTELEDTNG
jgi:hypothetical protein